MSSEGRRLRAGFLPTGSVVGVSVPLSSHEGVPESLLGRSLKSPARVGNPR